MHSKETLHQEPRVKSEDNFLENFYRFRKFLAIFVRKKIVLGSPLVFNHPCLLT